MTLLRLASVLVVVAPFLLGLVPFFMPESTMSKKWKWTLLLGGVLYSLIALFWVIATDNAGEVAQAKAEEGVRLTVKEEDGKVIDTLGKTIGRLNDLVSAQRSQIQDIHDSNFVTGKKPVSVVIKGAAQTSSPEFHISEVEGQPRPEFGKHATEFILTTTKVMNGGRVLLTCDGKINKGAASIASGGMTMVSGMGMVDDHTFASGISLPNWAPEFPLLITVYYDEEKLGACKATPQ